MGTAIKRCLKEKYAILHRSGIETSILRYDKCLIILGDCVMELELRLYTTNRKVAGSDLDEVIAFFQFT
jgi:hypothetical protein